MFLILNKTAFIIIIFKMPFNVISKKINETNIMAVFNISILLRYK